MVFSKIAFRNVKKNWRHSVSALLSLSASFVSLVLFDGYIDDIKSMYVESFHTRSELGDFIIEKPDVYSKQGVAEPWKFYIQENEQQLLEDFFKKHTALIRTRVRALNFQGMITNGQQSSIVLGRGSDITEGAIMRREKWSWNATYGIPLYKAEDANSILIGQGLAKKLGCNWTTVDGFSAAMGGYEPKIRPFNCPQFDLQISTMTYEAQLNALDVSAVGLIDGGYKDIDDSYAISSLTAIQSLLNTKLISSVSVELNNPTDYSIMQNLFKNEIQTKIPTLQMSRWQEHPAGDVYRKTMDLLNIFRNFVIAVILVISTLSVINTLIKIIKERNKEIGTLRSLGFKPREILRMFIYETFYLSSFGSAIGLILSLLFTTLLNFIQIKYKAGMLSEPVLFRINYTFESYLTAFIVLTIVGLMACLFSTRQSLSKRVIENLNHV